MLIEKLILFYCTFITKPSCILSQNLKEYLNSFLKNLFPSVKCLWYIYDEVELQCLEQALNMDFQLLSVGANTYLRVHSYFPKCDGYVVTIKNETIFNQLFETNIRLPVYFRPHNHILLYVQNNVSISDFSLKYSVNILGLDLHLILINESSKHTKDFFVDTKNIDTLQVISLRNDKVLAKWKTNVTSKNFTLEHFKSVQWKPIFKFSNFSTAFNINLVNYAPFSYYDKENSTYMGIDFKMMSLITKEWPIKYKLFELDPISNVSVWFTAVNETLVGKSDLSLCGFYHRTVLKVNGSMTVPYEQICDTFLVPKPQLLLDMSFVYQPFSFGVWILMIFLTTLTAALLHFILKYQFAQSGIFGCITNAIHLTVFGSLPIRSTQTDAYFQYIVISLSILNLLMVTAYSAGYTTSLSYPQMTKPIKTVQDMLDQKLDWIYDSKYYEGIIKDSPMSAVRHLINHGSYQPNKTERQNILKFSKHGMVVQIFSQGELVDINNINENIKKKFSVVECFRTNHVVLPFSSNSPFLSLFNMYVYRFIECGLIHIWYSDLVKAEEHDFKNYLHMFSPYENRLDYSPLNVQKLKGAFLLLIVGEVIALLVFFIEIKIIGLAAL